MRIVRLALLLDNRHNLTIVAGEKEDEQKINDVRQAILDAFNNYVNLTTVKPAYNILPLLSEQGEKYSRQIISLMQDLVNDIDTMDLYDMFHNIQLILTVINNLQKHNIKKLRESIDNAFPLQRETDRNRREMAKSKFENVVFKKLASILFKLSNSLNVMLGKSQSIVGGPSEPRVKEPTKQEQFMFRQCQLSIIHHLDNPDVFAKVWGYPDLKRRLIRLINQGKNRWAELYKDPKIMAETAAIMAEYRRRQTNEPFFEASEEEAQKQMNVLSPEEVKDRQEEMIEEMVKKRDEEAQKFEEEKKREIEEDRERHIRSEGMDALVARFSKRYL